MRPVVQAAVVAAAAGVGAGSGLAIAAANGLDQTAAAVTSIGSALVAVAITGFGLIAATTVRCRQLLDCGRPAEAIVLRVRRTGAALHSRSEPARPIVSVDLEVDLPGHGLVRTHATMPLHESEADRLVPGQRVPIRYDPGHPSRVALDVAG